MMSMYSIICLASRELFLKATQDLNPRAEVPTFLFSGFPKSSKLFVLSEHAVVVDVAQSGMDSNEDQHRSSVLSHWLTILIEVMVQVLLKLKGDPVFIVVVSRLASQL